MKIDLLCGLHEVIAQSDRVQKDLALLSSRIELLQAIKNRVIQERDDFKQKLKEAGDKIARLETFHSEVIAGCDIDKGPQGLYRQVKVVIGPGKTQDQIDLEQAKKALGVFTPWKLRDIVRLLNLYDRITGTEDKEMQNDLEAFAKALESFLFNSSDI